MKATVEYPCDFSTSAIVECLSDNLTQKAPVVCARLFGFISEYVDVIIDGKEVTEPAPFEITWENNAPLLAKLSRFGVVWLG